MKKILLSLALIPFLGLGMNAQKPNIQHIAPKSWWAGMNDSKLQILLHGTNLKNYKVDIKAKGIKLLEVAHEDNPNYAILYLDTQGAPAQDFNIILTDAKGKTYPITYKLDARMANASGDTKNDYVKGMYQDKVDRQNGSARHGGDLLGIQQHLDYFKDLGVTALWLNPVQENNMPEGSYHGYAITDYYEVDPRFGGNEAFKNFVTQARSRGLKVVMDMIFNHCGFDHPWVKNMPSKDWFNAPEWLKEGEKVYLQTSYKLTPVLDPYASEVDKKETVDGWFVKTKPDLNQRNPHVMTYLVQNSIWWIETVGIDGIRMDTYPYADRKAMSQWMKTLNEEYPNFNTVGEIWVTEPAYTAAWQKDSRLSTVNSYLKTVMDFSFYDKINLAKNEETDDWWKGLNRIYNSLCYDYLYENPSSVMAFIENHDTDRFLGEGKDTLALKQALALLLTINRIPQLYYGTEVLMNGTKTKTDGDVRRDFPGGFAGDTHDAFTAEGRTKAEQSMFDWLSKLLHWRRNNAVISRGRQVQFIPYKGVYVIARQLDNKTVLTILNGKRTPVELPLDRYTEVIGSHQEAKDVITDCKVRLDKTLKLKARETKVLEF